MERKPRANSSSSVLFFAYIAVLAVGAAGSLAFDSLSTYMLAVLAVGLPLYVTTSGAFLNDVPAEAAASGEHEDEHARILPFPSQRMQTQCDVTPALDASGHRRKLG